MKHHFPKPLKLKCDSLSYKRRIELADKLVAHFDTVEYWSDDEITAHNPRDSFHYGQAWNIIDRYGVAWQ